MWPFKKARLAQDTLNEEIERLLQWTPDAAELEKVKTHNLFVYDQMQPNCRDNWRVQQYERKYTAFTQKGHLMLTQDLGRLSHPLIFKDKPFTMAPSVELLPIRGELYKVPPDFIHSLDKVRGNGVQLRREEITVIVPTTHLSFKDRADAQRVFGATSRNGRDVQTITGLVEAARVNPCKAWIYYADEEYWKDLLNDYEFPVGKRFENAEGVVRKFYHYDEPPF
jgi:gamma-glutamylcyclotransferase (GGCT)/AIG2-like uncharacterized protein YtfP